MRHRTSKKGVVIFAFATLSQFACAHVSVPETERTRYLMGTLCTITLPSAHAAAAERAFDEIARVESLISTWRDDTELSRVNALPAGGRMTVSPELAALLQTTIDWSEQTGGAFNPLLGTLIDAYGVRTKFRIPSAHVVQVAIAESDVDNVRIEGGGVAKNADARFEEGGFGKGFALDRAIAVLKNAGVPYATIDFGGQVVWFGAGSRDVGIAHPLKRHEEAVVISVPAGSVATSAGTEQTFEIDGERYTHIIDPRTGKPLPPAGSVTVYADSAIEADILSTALFVMGPVEGVRWADAHGVVAIFVVPHDRELRLTTTREFINQRVGISRSILTDEEKSYK